MYKLSKEKKELVLSQLVEGASIRSVERITHVHRDTIMRLLVEAGNGALALMDRKMQNIPSRILQIDEICT